MKAIPKHVVAAILDAVGPTLAARTAPILRKVRGKTGPGTAETATGLVLAVDDRCFMVTASHVFDDVPPVSVGLMPRGRSNLDAVVWLENRRVMRLGGGQFDPCDVAAVEVAHHEVERWGIEPTPLTALVGYTVQPKRLAILHGYPAETVTFHYGTPDATAEPISFGTVGVPFEDWDSRYKRPIHQYLHWPGGEVLRTSLGSAVRAPLPAPPGMSGCGIWVVPETPGKLLRPDAVRLAGIQYAWFAKTGHVVGNSLIAVARLLMDGFPELSATVKRDLMEREEP